MVDFLVIGSINAMFLKNVAQLFLDDKINVGYNMIHSFENSKNVAAYWYSSFYVQKDPLKLHCFYDEDKYYRFINYDAINVDNINDIPFNYNGNMGVPGTFMFNYDKRQFDVIAFTVPDNEMITINQDDDITKELKQWNSDFRIHHSVIIKDGEYLHKYYRVFIRRR